MSAHEIPTPKYKHGDTVYSPGTEQSEERVVCPDCGDTKVWKVATATQQFEVPCQRCESFARTPPRAPIYAPIVGRLTIGSIQIDTKPFPETDSMVKYMCRETGVGGGTVYNETRLFETEDQAMVAAKLMAVEQTKRLQEQEHVKRNKTRWHLTLKDAEIDEAQEKERTTRYRLEDVLQAVAEMPNGYGHTAETKAVLDGIRKDILTDEELSAFQEASV